MKKNMMPLIKLGAALILLGAGSVLSAVAEDGVAVAIVYDTSGSMKERVRDGNGQWSPKYIIANRALESIAKQIQAFAAPSAGGPNRTVHAGLFTFDGSGCKAVVPLGPFESKAFVDWAKKFHTPGRGTPLGNALQTASRAVLDSKLSRKHVLVITDGANTVGPDPEETMPGIKKLAESKQSSLGIHFVAFDVDAKLFDPIRKLGATVVGASDEKQLNAQLENIMQRKILLEDEEAPKKN
jgi:hypothetical protein